MTNADCHLERETFSGVCFIIWGAEPRSLALAVKKNIANPLIKGLYKWKFSSLLCVCARARYPARHTICTVASVLPPEGGFQGSNPGQQSWLQSPLPTEPSHKPWNYFHLCFTERETEAEEAQTVPCRVISMGRAAVPRT